MNTKMLKHVETGEIIAVEIMAVNGLWAIAKDGYAYNMNFWREV